MADSAYRRNAKSASRRDGQRCELPRIDARGLSWRDFKRRGLRGSLGVVLTGLFDQNELATRWRPEHVLARHGSETFHADNTRGSYGFPQLGRRHRMGVRVISASAYSKQERCYILVKELNILCVAWSRSSWA
mmetsp:Transcript_20258/g.38889  ORF Transcript_20258/g.38889 Transcript_20258/m.38889 type:complete len:133 (-) Transcript_20258:375-773(-)